MTRAAARKLARLLRSQGFKVCISTPDRPRILFFTHCIIGGPGLRPSAEKHAGDSRSIGRGH